LSYVILTEAQRSEESPRDKLEIPRCARNDMIDVIEEFPMSEKQITLPITGMTCANCVRTVERALNVKTPGVVSASVNYATEKATVEYIPGATDRAAMIAAAGPRR
jgi:Cu+-exporting ATPase